MKINFAVPDQKFEMVYENNGNKIKMKYSENKNTKICV